MADSMDKFSKPIKTKTYKLGKVFFMEPRRNPKKPGRELVVNFDSRFPFVEKFKVNYSYYVRFFKKRDFAGNHYHIKKEELFIPVVGDFIVKLENIKDHSKEEILLNSHDYCILSFDKKVAHRVISKNNDSILLVLATSSNIDDDEFSFTVD